ncbi:unnamed protein product [Lactuca saligna]|uniref:Uncharacterized protein n=1 Tax=Lactuca saligna TaxID=75948 RepID=A0AA35ZMD5_LACSI|nr:unnamed protein product [Lactuca saligna]
MAAIVVDVADLMTEETATEGTVEELARMKDTPVLNLVMLVNLQLLVGGVLVIPTCRLNGLVFISSADCKLGTNPPTDLRSWYCSIASGCGSRYVDFL